MKLRLNAHRLLKTATLIAPLLTSLSVYAAKGTPEKMMGQIFDGPPVLSTTVLDPSAYVATRVQKLSQARVVYVNWRALGEMLKELGFSEPPTTLTPEVERAILDKAGYAMRMNGEPAEAYLADFRELYSIRYGGAFINYNFGSGRNGASGLADTKGIGITSLVRPWSDGNHGNGTVTLEEAIKEAAWSNILDHELPLGANRVLFVITTGTTTNPADPNSQPRALIVREDPLRPAYFQQNEGVKSELMSETLREMHMTADQKRMDMLLPKLSAALPQPAGGMPAGLSEGQKISAGLYEMANRIALQYATAYTRQILLSGVSTSNTELHGRALDYGATASVIGFPNGHLDLGESSIGTTDTLKSDLIFELINDLRKVLPADQAAELPRLEEMGAVLDKTFHKEVLRGLLELAGAPKEFSRYLAGTRDGNALAELILKLAKAGQEKERQWRFGQIEGRSGTYNIEKILNALVSGADLSAVLPDARLASDLRSLFASSVTTLERYVAREGISASSLREYMQRAVRARNTSMFEMRGQASMFKKLYAASKRQVSKQDPHAVQNLVDKMVERNVREFKAGDLQIETSSKSALRSGRVERSIFDMKTGVVTTTTRVLPRPLAPSCIGLFR